MAQKPETVFRMRVMPKFKEIPRSYWMSVQQKGIFGSPDVLGCVNGIFISLEFKKDIKSKPTELQNYKKEKIAQSRGMAFIIYPENWQDIHAFLMEISECSHVHVAYSELKVLRNKIFNNPTKEN